MEKLLIGNAGFDTITLNGFSVSPDEICHLKNRVAGGELYENNVRISAVGNITIKEINFFDFRLFRSNLDHTIYGCMTLFSSRPDGINIENMTLTKLKQKLSDACTRLSHKYSLNLHYELNNLSVSSCEINRTIIATDDITAYKRVFMLFALATITGQGTAYTASTEKLKGALTTQGLLCQRATYRYRIYDKSEHINKMYGGISFAKHLLRVEKTYLQKQAFFSDFQTLALSELSDELIETVFARKMQEIEAKIHQYIRNKLVYHTNHPTGRNATVPNILTSHPTWGEAIGDLVAYEAQYGLPCLFDLNDMISIINTLISSGIWTNTTTNDCYVAFRNSFEQIANAKGLWEDQYILMNDFFDKLKEKRIVEVKMWN